MLLGCEFLADLGGPAEEGSVDLEGFLEGAVRGVVRRVRVGRADVVKERGEACGRETSRLISLRVRFAAAGRGKLTRSEGVEKFREDGSSERLGMPVRASVSAFT